MMFFSTGVAGLLAGVPGRRGDAPPTEAENGVTSKHLPAWVSPAVSGDVAKRPQREARKCKV